MLNPAVRIIGLVFLAATLQGLSSGWLAVVASVLLATVVWCGSRHFMLLLQRARWLMLSIVLIYAYATPGQFVPLLPETMAPTFEGLREGMLQLMRLTAMLAGLALLLSTSTREQVLAGIYQLILPLRPAGVAPERFAVRLWLTLHYVENLPPESLNTLRHQNWNVDSLHGQHQGPDSMQLDFQRWNWRDGIVLVAMPLLWWVMR